MPSDFSQAFGVESRYESRPYGYKYRYPWWFPSDYLSDASGVSHFLTGNRARLYKNSSTVDSNGWRAPNRYLRAIEILDPGSKSVIYRSNGWEGPAELPTRVFSNLGYDWSSLSEDTRMGPFWNGSSQNAYDTAVTKALNGFRDGGATIGVNAAEAHKTFKELASVVHDLIRIWESFRHLDGKLLYDTVIGGSLPKGIAKRYLQYVYGVKPLMQDAKALYDFIPSHNVNQLIKSVGRGSDSASASNDQGFSLESTEQVKVTLYASVYNEGVYNLSRMGLLDPLGIVWELLPYSFLIDWLFPIGQVLSAYSADSGLSFHSGTLSRTVKTKTIQKILRGPISPSYFEYVDTPTGADATAEGLRFSRSLITSFPRPNIYYKSPFSKQHIANAGALILNRWGR